jgi:hypothetical protein
MSGIRTPRNDDTARIASHYAERIATARSLLHERMDSAGLSAGQGWRIHEEMVNHQGSTAIKLRPVHRTEVADHSFEVVIALK